MTDLALDTRTHDMVFAQGENGAALAFVVSGPAIVQKVKITLLGWLSEWFLDPDWGTPWLESILVKAPNLALVESIIRRQVMSVAGVTRIERLELDYSPEIRRLIIALEMVTDAGTLPLIVNLAPARPI